MCSGALVHSSAHHEALPRTLKPVNYKLRIHGIDTVENKFQGQVAILLKVNEPTDELHLNYRDLTIDETSYKVEVVGQTVQTHSVVETINNQEKEYFVLRLNSQLPQDSQVVVTIAYHAIIQTNMAGFYRSRYKDSNEDKVMLTTQFEATDARRAFPCLDEPNLKATFDLTLESPVGWTSLSNMPIHSETEQQNVVVTRFETTPIMSTYLLAWGCGEFEYINAFTEKLYDGKKVELRLYTTLGLKQQGQFALGVATKVLDYFSTIFQIPYALPKVDLLAVHEFSHGAMENWGLITYRSTALLFDESTSDPSYKQRVAYVVAHELAHQWFGNLVTMDWWNELWLNEGFATWVGFNAVNYLYPEWDIWATFVSDSLQNALNLDGLRGSHPIEVPVYSALDIDQVFDAISYLKGASTILMLSQSIGEDVFLKGVALYLEKFKFNNATTKDLWDAISEVSHLNIGEIMNSWITKIGFPIIKVDKKDDKLVLSQQRFLNSGDIKPEEDETVWWIPLNVSTGSELDDQVSVEALNSKTAEIQLDHTGFFKLNKDTKGVYRVLYSTSIMKEIIKDVSKLSSKDKVGLIADTSSTSISGDGKTSTLLELLYSLKNTDDYVVWLELGKRLSQLSIAWYDQPHETQEALRVFGRALYSKKAVELVNNLDQVNTEDYLKNSLRAEILFRAGLLGVPEVVALAESLFAKLVKESVPIHPSLKKFVLSSLVANSSDLPEETYNYLINECVNSKSLDGREITLAALGHIKDQKYVSTVVELLTNNTVVPIMDSHFLGISLSRNSASRDVLWSFFQKNYAIFHQMMSTNMVILDRFIKQTLMNFNSVEVYNEIESFFKDKNVHGFDRSLKQVLDEVKTNHAWVSRDSEDVQVWLSSNGYMG